MPKSKAELIVELREQMKGTPYKMPLSKLKLHELEVAQATLLKMKSDHSTAANSIPVVGAGRPKSRAIEPAQAEDEDDEDAIKVPKPPAPRLTKAPPIRVAKDPEHPIGNPTFKKKVKVEEPEPTRGKSPASHICNCPHCPTRK